MFTVSNNKIVSSEKISSQKTIKKIIHFFYYSPYHVLTDIHEVMGESYTFFKNIWDYFTENHSVLMDMVKNENLTKF